MRDNPELLYFILTHFGWDKLVIIVIIVGLINYCSLNYINWEVVPKL